MGGHGHGGHGRGGMRINNGGSGFNFNRWGANNTNYMNMNGFIQVDYSGGWNPTCHDAMLQKNIDQVFFIHDINKSG
jgi:hypothetical protein